MRLSAAKPAPFVQDPATLGEHLKQRRHELELRQRDVAGQIGIDTWTYLTWESDRAPDRVHRACVEVSAAAPVCGRLCCPSTLICFSPQEAKAFSLSNLIVAPAHLLGNLLVAKISVTPA
jgi:DNA-binding XRE family transcriptional regulator